MKIVLIEPSKSHQSIISKVLEEYASKIFYATSSKEAFDIFEKIDPDFICVSYMLSDTNAIEFCKKLYIDLKKKHIPVIMLTSEQNEELYSNAIMSGVTEVIKKSNLSDLNSYFKKLKNHNKKDFFSGNILYVDDSKTDNKIVTDYFEGNNLNIKYLTDPIEAYNYFKNNEIDLVITDILLEGHISGLDFLRMIRETPGLKSNIPVLVMTAFDNLSKRTEIYKAGGNDYVLKPFFKEEFMSRVYNLLTNKKLTDKVEEQKNKLEEISLRDPLTNLYNRRYILEMVPQKFAEAIRHGFNLSLIMGDIDHFKKINDTYGHLKGDFVLKALAGLLSANIRKEDVVARYGGEEFLIILTHCSQEFAIEKAENIRKEIELLNPENIHVTISFGIASISFCPQCSLEELINFADMALYDAKNNGRNRVEIYKSGLIG